MVIAQFINEQTIEGYFVGPRKEMVTPWSTNAVEITQNMNLSGILRIEEFFPVDSEVQITTQCCRHYTVA